MAPPNGATRSKHYHGGAKGNLTGNTVRPAPAWRAKNIPDKVSTAATAGSAVRADDSSTGSKILISSLPVDVSESEIVDLLRKTVGRVDPHGSFSIYNARGNPHGMAIVSFVRTTDAARAREMYNGKVIDGKRPIKLEVILDSDVVPTHAAQRPPANAPSGPRAKPKPKTLLDRIGQPKGLNGLTPPQQPKGPKRQPPSLASRVPLTAPIAPSTSTAPTAPIPARKRQKKGPKRVKKSVADLDREMEEYIATAARDDAAMETA